MKPRNFHAFGALLALACAFACSRDRTVESPDDELTPASRIETRAVPERAQDEPDRTPDPMISPETPTEIDTPAEQPDTLAPSDETPDIDVDSPPVPNVPPTELPPSSGPDGGELNWIDDTGNTVQ